MFWPQIVKYLPPAFWKRVVELRVPIHSTIKQARLSLGPIWMGLNVDSMEWLFMKGTIEGSGKRGSNAGWVQGNQ